MTHSVISGSCTTQNNQKVQFQAARNVKLQFCDLSHFTQENSLKRFFLSAS